jgi:hypothetical protein
MPRKQNLPTPAARAALFVAASAYVATMAASRIRQTQQPATPKIMSGFRPILSKKNAPTALKTMPTVIQPHWNSSCSFLLAKSAFVESIFYITHEEDTYVP